MIERNPNPLNPFAQSQISEALLRAREERQAAKEIEQQIRIKIRGLLKGKMSLDIISQTEGYGITILGRRCARSITHSDKFDLLVTKISYECTDDPREEHVQKAVFLFSNSNNDSGVWKQTLVENPQERKLMIADEHLASKEELQELLGDLNNSINVDAHFAA